MLLFPKYCLKPLDVPYMALSSTPCQALGRVMTHKSCVSYRRTCASGEGARLASGADGEKLHRRESLLVKSFLVWVARGSILFFRTCSLN